MRKLLSTLSVRTFIHAKIITLSILLICVCVYGYTFVTASMERNSVLIENVNENEIKVLEITSISYEIRKLNNEILSKCLDKSDNTYTISSDLEKLSILREELGLDTIRAKKIDSLYEQKIYILKKISNFTGVKLRMSDVVYDTTIRLVNTTTRKTLFTTKVNYDTISRTYSNVDLELFNKEYNRIILKNSDTLNSLVKENNDLSLEISQIINEYSLEKFQDNLKEYTVISKKIDKNFKYYTMGVIFIMLIFGINVYLLITDIAKKNKSESRNLQMIDMLIERSKK